MDRIKIIDEDLAHSANGTVKRNGLNTIFNAVAMRSAGLVLAIEVSRLARNNSDWYGLLDLSAVMDCLIGDEDGLYHPGLFNDRLLLGMKGTMAEAELHVLRARLNGGIRNKAARGELRRGLPIGLVWGEQDGEILFDPNQAVKEAIALVFKLFSQLGSVRRVWLHFQTEELELPSRRSPYAQISWTIPTYHAINAILGNPVYAGVYAFAKSPQESSLNEHGELKKRVVKLPREKWAVFIQEHHEGFIDWQTYQMNRKGIDSNTRPGRQKAGAVREGAALLQGLATCGRCARRLRVYYQGEKASAGLSLSRQ